MTDHPDIQLDKSDLAEAGLELPFDRIPPATLHNMLADYVSRDWSELTDAGFSLEDKIAQAHQQLVVKGTGMANRIEPQQTVTLEELAISNSFEIAALVNALERKSLLTRLEVLQELAALRQQATAGQGRLHRQSRHKE